MTVMDTSGQQNRPHQGKFTEGLLNNELILKTLNIKAGQTVLDAGCGTGYMSRLFAKAASPAGLVYALDPDKHFIEVLKKETQGTNIIAFLGDITRPTGLDGSSIDVIYLSTVLHQFSNKQVGGFLEETIRLLKPDAKLAIVEIVKEKTPFGPPMETRISPEELKAMVPLVPLTTEKAAQYFYLQVFRNQKRQP